MADTCASIFIAGRRRAMPAPVTTSMRMEKKTTIIPTPPAFCATYPLPTLHRCSSGTSRENERQGKAKPEAKEKLHLKSFNELPNDVFEEKKDQGL